MILSKDELVERFKKIEEALNKGIAKKGNPDMILIINSHLNALEKIEDLEKKISKNKIENFKLF